MRDQILETFYKLESGYKNRDEESIDVFMDIISDSEDVQMIGIGATEPEAYEWFTGKEQIKEIILSDWEFWGDVHFDIPNMRISEKDGVAWFSLCAELEQVEMKEDSWKFYLEQMKELLDSEGESAHDRMFEAAHFGIRRVREKNLGVGHKFKMVITGVLVKEEIWRFRMLHWAMPVD